MMRETTFPLRERASETAGGGAATFLRRHRRTWLIAAGGAVLLGGVGAFETGDAAPWTLYSYWLTVMFAAGLIAAWALDRFDLRDVPLERLPARAAAMIVAVALLVTPVVWVVAGLALNGSWSPFKMLHLFPQSLLVACVFGTLQVAVERPRRMPPAETPVAAEPLSPARLPDRLRGARLLAVEAEDHYLRFHTDRGSDLLLMRLSDAVAELAGLGGAQTHRSWWVARDAVAGVRRSGGRATLTLVNGLAVPVSRRHAPRLRRQGWF
ncbi:MAG: hypothetical protein QOH86_1277 [Sphingomonadales bacterium]|jgi:hypothetical protein|nr:hypothetical protein [Sphingomonadales bacterium]